MIDINRIIDEFNKHGGVLKTSELNAIGLNSRQIKKLLNNNKISKIKQGYYERTGTITPEEVIISRLFPNAVIFLESALHFYEYTDRIPLAWQIAVDRDSNKSKYNIDYPFVEPFFQELRFLSIGVNTIEIDNISVKIFNRDRTICDLMRYEHKIEKEVFSNAVMRYIKDPKKNIRQLFEYAKIFNITKKVQIHIGKWL
ncbi:Transcriptional regulator, AbiEi antitoxin, Type IV TA system [Dethiosulfatibacter aminovorans DSM 17477]|uniref:Transcriptional regulator, AbiEi antitoxin, Type IV TA system n=1 Tax=Dethiosulfatibacter aminovorans DSM 17477 TaxID=1121476 RepID=A0A1M6IGM0_9FIRM|nr:type IV toxin-antitoxin system AbiEi family antitoxin domain-containing protein [Dethiosulfatibacter aminovorans]SHJ33570.1 Transcriptional regulator, AbiEi antitoxin, Type IV TA system [Dethiosulfatibacter aminovorans DSM 17477]